MPRVAIHERTGHRTYYRTDEDETKRMTTDALSTPRNRTALSLLFIGAYLLLAFAWWDVALNNFSDPTYLASSNALHGSMFLNDITSMPMYALWFRVLAFFTQDTVHRQILNWVLLVALAGTLPALFRVRLSWLYAGVLVAVPLFEIVPYVSLFAAVFFVAGAVVVIRRQLLLTQASAVACAAAFVVAYSRPEYQNGVFLAALATVLCAVAERKTKSPRALLYAVVPALLLACAMAYVVKHSDAGRSGVAFAQHFTLDSRGHASQSESAEYNFADNFDRAYAMFGIDPLANGGKHSIGDFVRANPRLFVRRVLANLLSPVTLLFSAVMLVTALLLWRRGRQPAMRAASLYLLLIAVPTIVSMLLVFPDRHYMSIVFPVILLAGLQLMGPKLEARLSSSWMVPAVLFALMCVVCLRGVVFKRGPYTAFRSGLRSVGCLRAADAQLAGAPVTALDMDSIQDVVKDVYIDPRITLVRPQGLAGQLGLESWITQQRPGWVLLTPVGARAYQTQPAALAAFLASQGYASHPCPASTRLTVYAHP